MAFSRTDGRDSGDNFAELQFVQDGCLARSIQAHWRGGGGRGGTRTRMPPTIRADTRAASHAGSYGPLTHQYPHVLLAEQPGPQVGDGEAHVVVTSGANQIVSLSDGPSSATRASEPPHTSTRHTLQAQRRPDVRAASWANGRISQRHVDNATGAYGYGAARRARVT